MKTLSVFATILIAASTLACGPAAGHTVRVATATPAELKAVVDEDNVWYEFQEGDVVPVNFGFLGSMAGGTEKPAVLRAKRHFFFVMLKNQSMQISLDGKSFVGQNGMQSLIGVIPREDGKGGQLGWFIYVGEPNGAQLALDDLLESVDDDGS